MTTTSAATPVTPTERPPVLSHLADTLVQRCGRLTVSSEAPATALPGSILAANHSSLADPAVVLAALHRLDVRPVVLATAGLWRIPLLGTALRREGHIPVQRGDRHAATRALADAADALRDGRTVLIYGEGGLPHHAGPEENAPRAFRSGLARLARTTAAPVIPLGQAGARGLLSGSPVKQLAGALTAPVRRPALHVHLGAPLQLEGPLPVATAAARAAVTSAWRTAVARTGAPVTLAA